MIFLDHQVFKSRVWLSQVSALFAIFIASLLSCATAIRAEEAKPQVTFEIRESLIEDASVMYKMALSQKGNLQAVDRGLEFLRLAEDQLDSQLSRARAREILGKINAGREELNHLRDLFHDHHFAVFPMSRFVTDTALGDPEKNGGFVLSKLPAEVAIERAGQRFGEFIASQKVENTRSRIAVVFVSMPETSDLEVELRYLFARIRLFEIQPGHKLVSALATDELNHIKHSQPTTAIREKLWKTFENDQVLLVRVPKPRTVGDVVMGKVEGSLLSRDSERITRLGQSDVSVDRRWALLWIIVTHLLIIAGAPLVYRFATSFSKKDSELPTWSRACLIGIVGFLIGRGALLAMGPALSRIAPVADSLAVNSIWWPALVGGMYMLGPAIVIRIVMGRFSGLSTFLSTIVVGPMFAVIALGGAAFLIQATLTYYGVSGLMFFVPLAFSPPMLGLVVGRGLDGTDSMKVTWSGIAVALSLVLGIVWCYGALLPLLLILVGAMVLTHFAVHSTVQDETQSSPQTMVNEPVVRLDAGKTATTMEELIHLACNPPYFETAQISDICATLDPWLDGKIAKIALIGPAGIGKSASINALHSFANEHDATVLRGVCTEPEPGRSPRPFGCFSEAISDHFSVNVFGPQAEQMQKVDAVLGGIFNSVVPFADMLFPPTKDGHSGSKSELFVAIANMLRRLASDGRVLLILDDV